ncbi:hypothetical protein V6N13_091174 [Hibiscus sabdariffa]
MMILLRVVLLLLSTRLGSLVFCGRQCLEDKWPFLNRSVEKREKVVQMWFKEHRLFFVPIRVAFIHFSSSCAFSFSYLG